MQGSVGNGIWSQNLGIFFLHLRELISWFIHGGLPQVSSSLLGGPITGSGRYMVSEYSVAFQKSNPVNYYYFFDCFCSPPAVDLCNSNPDEFVPFALVELFCLIGFACLPMATRLTTHLSTLLTHAAATQGIDEAGWPSIAKYHP